MSGNEFSSRLLEMDVSKRWCHAIVDNDRYHVEAKRDDDSREYRHLNTEYSLPNIFIQFHGIFFSGDYKLFWNSSQFSYQMKAFVLRLDKYNLHVMEKSSLFIYVSSYFSLYISTTVYLSIYLSQIDWYEQTIYPSLLSIYYICQLHIRISINMYVFIYHSIIYASFYQSNIYISVNFICSFLTI